MKTNLRITLAVLFLGSLSSSSLFSQEACNDFQLYYINIPTDFTQTTLYSVEINGNDATLTPELVVGSAAHIGLSPEGLVYIVAAMGKVSVYDPTQNTVSEEVEIFYNGVRVENTPSIVVDPSNGDLYVASTSDNAIYIVEPLTGDATLFTETTVTGGDMVFTNDGSLWIINRIDDTFRNLSDGVSTFSVSLPNINGVATLADGTLIVSNDGSTSFNLIDPTSGEVLATTISAGITFRNGDLASGCVDSDPGIETDCFASEVVEFNQGLQTNGQPVALDRSDENQALGEPDRINAAGGFVSLGVGGSITLQFEGAVFNLPGNDIKVYETSFSGNNCGFGDDESADIELSSDGVTFFYAATICRDGEVDIAAAGLNYVTQIRITSTVGTSTLDGYDVDGVEAINGCGSIPGIETGDCYASEMVEYVQGIKSNGSPIDLIRTNPLEALGEPERTDEFVFVTLGYEGSLTLGFNGGVPNEAGDDIEVVETSFGSPGCAAYREYADIYVSVDGLTFYFASTICKANRFVDISDAGAFDFINYVRIVNNDEETTTPDAFDVDGVVAIHNCMEMPGLVISNEQLSEVQVAPNPTVGPTNISFHVAAEALTTLEVYNMNGVLVETIFHQNAHGNQEYRVEFDGSNLPHGLYIVKLTSKNEVAINRVMIHR